MASKQTKPQSKPAPKAQFAKTVQSSHKAKLDPKTGAMHGGTHS